MLERGPRFTPHPLPPLITLQTFSTEIPIAVLIFNTFS